MDSGSDITAGRADEQALKLSMRHVLLSQDALGLVTWMWDIASNRTRWFGDLSPLVGLSPGSFSAGFREYLPFVHPDDQAMARNTMIECMKGIRPTYQQLERVVWRDGSIHWLETYGMAEFDERSGRALVMMGVVKDVTARKKTEEALAASEAELRRLNSTLEQRVAERTTELHAANAHLTESLASLNRARHDLVQSEKLASLGSLVAGISHEMNTPVGNALLVASTVREKALEFAQQVKIKVTRSALDQFFSETIEGMSVLLANLDRTVDLIRNFKQLASDQTSDQRRTFRLAAVIGEAMSAIGPTLKTRPITVHIDVPDDIEMDSYPGPLSRIVINLVNNSIIHGFEGRERGSIELSAHLRGPDAVEIVYADDGVGMNAEVVRHIFDPFFTTKLGKGGSGLGMHITYNLTTTVLGGRIQVSSKLKEGARFELLLPRVAGAALNGAD